VLDENRLRAGGEAIPKPLRLTPAEVEAMVALLESLNDQRALPRA
jgi:hypothetical protein